MQEHYLKVIDTTFSNQILASVPEMERDVTGLPMIEKMAKAMFGEDWLTTEAISLQPSAISTIANTMEIGCYMLKAES